MTFKIKNGLFGTVGANKSVVFTTDNVNFDILGIWFMKDNRMDIYSKTGINSETVSDFESAIALLS